MIRVVLNQCYGGLSLSKQAKQILLEKYNIDSVKIRGYSAEFRTSPELLSVCDEIGLKHASGKNSNLKIIEIRIDIKWHVAEYEGCEHIAEDHRTWYYNE